MRARQAGWARNSWRSSPKASASVITLPQPTSMRKRVFLVPTMFQKRSFRIILGISRRQSMGCGRASLFTNRQLVTLSNFSSLIKEAEKRAIDDATVAGYNKPHSTEYAKGVATYLSFALSRTADRNNTICTWDAGPTGTRSSTGGSARTSGVSHAFTRQALPMTWDFAEASPFSSAGGSIDSAMASLIPAIAAIPTSGKAQPSKRTHLTETP